ncbi:MAG TPA: NADH-quinone oxidoreductase subunit L, partial [Alphaproteobacteria bacterium]|nr:NADH-quinone oxidoreductase subunit L [Alphaproteobacteria bacterium]
MELIAVFAPLVAFVIAGLFGKRIGDAGCQFITCAGVILAAMCSVILFYDVALQGHSYVTVLAEWINSGHFSVQWALRVDTLSVIMMCVINIVSACVHVYSVGYMSDDPAKGRFMAYLLLFQGAMVGIVLSDNILLL